MTGKNRHIINHISTISKSWFAFVLLFFCISHSVHSQERASEGLTIMRHTAKSMEVEFRIQNIYATSSDGQYATLHTPAANSYSHKEGQPLLPQQRQMIAIPKGSVIGIEVVDAEWDTLYMYQLGFQMPLTPCLGAIAKETVLTHRSLDSTIYATDSLIGDPIVSIRPMGLMRNTAIATLTISPIRYNPSTGLIAVCRRLTATVTFSGGDTDHADSFNPLLSALPVATPSNGKSYMNPLAQDSVPQVYLVVSGSRYRETLKPLLEWKRQEGYVVDELYFNYGEPRTVKDSLQSHYDNATQDHPAPLFILIVGDMGDIGMWTPQHLIQGLETHRSDFYYSEFTGDMLPDALIGRISVEDTSQLRHVIEKTLAYEKGDIADTMALRRSLLVAGREETPPAPTVTNGQVNYLKQLIKAHDPEHDTICYYNPESSDMRDEIMSSLRQGVGLMNYTSHCNNRGWRNPKLNINDVNGTDLFDSHPFIAVNNCCRSNDVAGECFGEELLRKAGGGAVAAIGATNETLWEEDYYWSVGFGSITTTPTPDSTTAGAFDRLLHPFLQAPDEQAWTMGQMLLAGNSAVEASGSPFSGFYWEIYLLLGDPSLMPHIGALHPMTLECDSIQLGDTAVTLAGTPGARVAVTCGDTLMGRGTLDANGEALLQFVQPVASTIVVTATRQFHRAKQIAFHLTDDSVSHESIVTLDGNDISIFPNPSYGSVTVRGITMPTTMKVYDAMGRNTMTTIVTEGQSVDLKGKHPSGVYTLVFSFADRTIIKKTVIR